MRFFERAVGARTFGVYKFSIYGVYKGEIAFLNAQNPISRAYGALKN